MGQCRAGTDRRTKSRENDLSSRVFGMYHSYDDRTAAAQWSFLVACLFSRDAPDHDSLPSLLVGDRGVDFTIVGAIALYCRTVVSRNSFVVRKISAFR
jgi:hypothetical protein